MLGLFMLGLFMLGLFSWRHLNYEAKYFPQQKWKILVKGEECEATNLEISNRPSEFENFAASGGSVLLLVADVLGQRREDGLEPVLLGNVAMPLQDLQVLQDLRNKANHSKSCFTKGVIQDVKLNIF